MLEIASALLSIVATSACSYAVWSLQSNKNKKDNQSEALKLLMKAEQKRLYKEYEDKESLTVQELKDYEELYNCYHALGGNGTMTALWNKVQNMNIKED